MEKKTTLCQIDICRTGEVREHFVRTVVDDSGATVMQKRLPPRKLLEETADELTLALRDAVKFPAVKAKRGEQRTILARVEVTPEDGVIFAEFAKVFIDDDGQVESEPHRVPFVPGEDMEAQMALVNRHLGQMNAAQVDKSELAPLRAARSLVQTKEIVAAYREKRLRLQDAMRERDSI